MADSEMVERVAKAIWDKDFELMDAWDDLPRFRQRAYEDQAIAVMAAMREPTEKMLSEADSAIPQFEAETNGSRCMGVDGAKDCWRAMIDAALAFNPPADEREHDVGEAGERI